MARLSSAVAAEFVGEEGAEASATFTRLDNEGCDPSDAKGVLTDIQQDGDDEVVVFIPSGFGTSEYAGVITLVKDAADPDLLVLQYDPDGSGFRDVPACTDATFGWRRRGRGKRRRSCRG